MPGRPDRRLALGRGERLFRRGETAVAVYRLGRGRLQLERTSAEGALLVLHSVLPGETFAEASLFTDVYHCDAVATTAAQIEVFDRDRLLGELRSDPERALAWIDHLSRLSRDLRFRLELSAVRPAREKVLRLLTWMDDSGRLGAARPAVTLAAELGIAPETVYRVLAGLEAEGRIRRRGKAIDLLRR